MKQLTYFLILPYLIVFPPSVVWAYGRELPLMVENEFYNQPTKISVTITYEKLNKRKRRLITHDVDWVLPPVGASISSRINSSIPQGRIVLFAIALYKENDDVEVTSPLLIEHYSPSYIHIKSVKVTIKEGEIRVVPTLNLPPVWEK
jgi:hypothetical protein